MTTPLIPLRRVIALGALSAVVTKSVLAATFTWLVALGLIYASDPGPALPAMTLTAALLFPLAVWAATSMLAVQSADVRAVLTAAVGPDRLLAADGVVVGGWVVVAALLGVAACAIVDPHPATVGRLALGLLLHLLTGTAGAGVAAWAHAVRLTRGSATLLVSAMTVVSAVASDLPPIGPMLTAWLDDSRPPTGPHAAWALGAPIVVTVVSAASAVRARTRRL